MTRLVRARGGWDARSCDNRRDRPHPPHAPSTGPTSRRSIPDVQPKSAAVCSGLCRLGTCGQRLAACGGGLGRGSHIGVKLRLYAPRPHILVCRQENWPQRTQRTQRRRWQRPYLCVLCVLCGSSLLDVTPGGKTPALARTELILTPMGVPNPRSTSYRLKRRSGFRAARATRSRPSPALVSLVELNLEVPRGVNVVCIHPRILLW